MILQNFVIFISIDWANYVERKKIRRQLALRIARLDTIYLDFEDIKQN